MRPSTRSRLGIETLEDRTVPAIVTWDGGSFFSNNWTAGGNWIGNVAPKPGDDLVFPAGAGRLTSNFNDFAPGTAFGSITFTGGGYKLNGNRILIGSLNPFDPAQVVNSAGNNTIALPMEISTVFFNPSMTALDVSFSVASGTTLTTTGVMSGNSDLGNIVKLGTGTLVLAG